MIRKIVIATAAYMGRSMIKRAVSGAVKRVLGRGKPEDKTPQSAAGKK